ncbi:MAG: hypothetical protein OHK0012_03420 [Synechococcales cyanobacterium]
MPKSLRHTDHFVLLLPDVATEQFVSESELRAFLSRLLEAYPHLRDPDLQRVAPEQQVQRLLDTTCSVEIAPGETVQWYAVRLHKPSS